MLIRVPMNVCEVNVAHALNARPKSIRHSRRGYPSPIVRSVRSRNYDETISLSIHKQIRDSAQRHKWYFTHAQVGGRSAEWPQPLAFAQSSQARRKNALQSTNRGHH